MLKQNYLCWVKIIPQVPIFDTLSSMKSIFIWKTINTKRTFTSGNGGSQFFKKGQKIKLLKVLVCYKDNYPTR